MVAERISFELEIERLLGNADERTVLGEAGQSADPCKSRWDAEVAKLPAEVRRAIENTPANGPANLIAWAMQKGIRNTDTLTRLAFYAAYGRLYGYCAPSTPRTRKAWTDTASVVKGQLDRPWPPLFQTGPSPCAKGQKKAPADKPSLDITGRYYSKSPRRVYVINQAGTHFEGYGSQIVSPKFKSRPFWGLSGDLHGSDFYYFNRSKPTEWGRLSESNGTLYLDNTQLLPLSRRPTLWMGHSRKLDDPYVRNELAPLDPRALVDIQEILNKPHIDKILAVFFDHGGTREQGVALEAMHQTFDKGCLYAKPPQVCEPNLERFHESDIPLVRMFATRLLTINKWTSARNVTRSHIDWIQLMLDHQAPDESTTSAGDFRKYLGLRINPKRAAQAGEHKYKLELTLTGASFLVAGYFGSITVEKTTGRTFKKTFDLELFGGTVALTLFDKKIGDTFSGAARSYIEWTENDVPGSANYARASASLGFGTVSAQLGFMHILGNGTYPPLEVFFQEASLGLPDVDAIREKMAERQKSGSKFTAKDALDFGLSASVLTGSITEPGTILDKFRKRKPPSVDLSRKPQDDIAVERTLSSQIHFCLDSAEPTDEARQALRMLCARELPVFRSPGAYLTVVGHADTLGSAEHNIKLSKARADNTLRSIRDILGDKKFLIRNVFALGLGELLAGAESGFKTVPAPKHRRVELFLNGVLTLTLRAEGGP